ncbi:MAG: pantetheine-phosphate adenylyltransferase [Bacteroidales bacterium]|nr:pantetheine-phosphate adenylyltransferase [Bacteroidales bacterium]
MKIAVFPGSFDPITRGHQAVLESAMPLFDRIYVAIGVNAAKQGFFSIEQRKRWIRQAFPMNDNLEIIDYDILTVDLCRQLNAGFILRGLRNSNDFIYENEIAQANRHLNPEVQTLFFTTPPELSFVSSSIVRDVYRHHGDYSAFVPQGVVLG